MQITVTGRHLHVSDEVKSYAQEKTEKLLKFFDKIQAIDVVIQNEGEELAVETIVSAGSRTEFIGREVGPDAFALIDQTVSKLERQITKYKEQLRNRKHPGK